MDDISTSVKRHTSAKSSFAPTEKLSSTLILVAKFSLRRQAIRLEPINPQPPVISQDFIMKVAKSRLDYFKYFRVIPITLSMQISFTSSGTERNICASS